MTNPFEEIAAQLNRMEAMIERLSKERVTPKAPEPPADLGPLTIDQAAAFLRLSKGTLYGLVHRKAIPHCKSRKRLYFDRSQLLNWINAGHQQTVEQIIDDARHSREAT